VIPDLKQRRRENTRKLNMATITCINKVHSPLLSGAATPDNGPAAPANPPPSVSPTSCDSAAVWPRSAAVTDNSQSPGGPRFTGRLHERTEPVLTCRHFKRMHKSRDRIGGFGYWCSCEDERPNSGSRFRPLENLDAPTPTSCTRRKFYKGKCKKIVKILELDQSLKPVRPVPDGIVCGSLRKHLRSMYPPEITLVQEMSIKTATKVEVQPCKYCEGLQYDRVDEWKRQRQLPADVDEDALDRFSTAFSANIPVGWNKKKSPYIPNGHASLGRSRCNGGTWNKGTFSSEVEVQLVHSSGKPRIVTLYSEFNTSVLSPLHHSLYSFLKRRGWLLVGSPTSERLRHLRDNSRGSEWLSFDYESATDNIKTAYVRRAVEILIEKGEGLTFDEVRCLRVVSNLDVGLGPCETGQPMGSLMSFPLLCLINKTVVDLALTDLMLKKHIGFKEWTRHPCLINGDDLLTRHCGSGHIGEAIRIAGGHVGLKTNDSKTMVSPDMAEMNSTVFRDCNEERKTNVAALWMGEQVSDVLGFAAEATAKPASFLAVVEANASRLARQKTKTIGPMTVQNRCAMLRLNRRSKTWRAMNSTPSSEAPKVTNLFPVEPVPAGFSLTREEEIAAIDDTVNRVRSLELWRAVLPSKARAVREQKKITTSECEGRPKKYRLLKSKKTTSEDMVMSCLVRKWEEKQYKALMALEYENEYSLIVSDLSPINAMIDEIKKFKQKRVRPIPSAPPGGSSEKFGDYVSLTDDY